MGKIRSEALTWVGAAVLATALVNRFLWPISGWWFIGGIVVVLFLSSIYIIPVIHYGLEKVLDRRTGRAVKEGFQLTWPIIGTFELFRIEIETTRVAPFTSTSFDKLDMKVEGSIQWWPDRENLRRFIEVDEETIKKGLVDAVKARIGELAGRSIGADFYRNRAALAFLINCHLRLSPQSRSELETKLDTKCQKSSDGELGETVCDLKALMSDQLYVEELRRQLKEKPPSELEELYGIEIKGFFLADVNFTKETRRALEAQRQRGLQMEGATEVLDWKREQAKKLKKLGLAPKDAIDTTDITVEQVITEKGQEPRVKKQIISVGDAAAVLELLRRLKP